MSFLLPQQINLSGGPNFSHVLNLTKHVRIERKEIVGESERTIKRRDEQYFKHWVQRLVEFSEVLSPSFGKAI